MKNRVLSLLLCFVLCFSLSPMAAFAEEVDMHDVQQNTVHVLDEAVTAVQIMIDELPTVETVTADDYDTVQDAYEAYEALTAEQQAQITGAEVFEALFAWFNEQVKTTSLHTHCICGGTTDIGDHTAHSDRTFTAWENSSSLPTDEGNYYLTQDVTISNVWYPADGTVLCLNGYRIISSASNAAVWVSKNKTFTLTDCQSKGTITYMKPVTSEDDTASKGIFNCGSFFMYGGLISGNSAKAGGGVYVSDGSTFTMYNGEIKDNHATSGGGVYVGGTFTMYNGLISGNSASNGGGVYIGKDTSSGSFFMYGGQITGNSATYHGGGVFDAGNFTIGGNAVVTDNIKGSSSTANNVRLTEGITITVQDGFAGSIGVTTATLPTESSNIAIVSGGAAYANRFSSDLTNYKIAVSDSDLVLQVKNNCTTTHTDVNGDNNCDDCDKALVAKVTNDTNTHYYTTFDEAYNALESGDTLILLSNCGDSETAITFTKNFTLDLNGKTLNGDVSIQRNANIAITDSATGGKFSGGLTVYSGAVVKISGGWFNNIVLFDSNRMCTDLLADGYAFFSADDRLENASVKGVSKMFVKPHICTFSDSQCTCGRICVHPANKIDTNHKCEICGTQTVAKVTSTGAYYGTFAAAIEAAQTDDTIVLLTNIVLSSTVEIAKNVTITSADTTSPKQITTETNEHDYLLNITGNVTLKDVMVDGGAGNSLTAKRAAIAVNGGTLTLNSGAVIRNNNNTTENGVGGGICVISGELKLNDGMITGNSGYFGGGIGALEGIIEAKAGIISGNKAQIGGGCCMWEPSAVGTVGGTLYVSGTLSITGNRAEAYANGINCNMTSTICISGAPSIEDGIYLDGSDAQGAHASAIINGALTEGAAIQFASFDGKVGMLIAKSGDGYTITESDLSKLRYESDTLHLKLTDAGTIILQGDASCTAPEAIENLIYNGRAQELITEGTATDGMMQYSLDGINYSTEIPTGIDSKTYTVWYKAVGNEYYDDSAPASLTVTIAPRDIKDAEITLGNQLTYNGKQQTQTIASVEVDKLTLSIDTDYSIANNTGTNADKYTLTITGTGNYTGVATKEWTIAKAVVTIKAIDKYAYVNSSAPSLSEAKFGKDYIITGLVGHDKLENGVTVVLTYEDTLNMNKCGEYAIIPSVIGEDSRYDFVFQNGKLVVRYCSILAMAGAGGMISPAGATAVSYGKDQSFTIIPDNGYSIADVKIDGRSIGTVETYIFENVQSDHTIEAVFTAVTSNPFTDVHQSNWFYNDVMYVYENGLMNGTSETTFSPYASTTRGMIATILYRLDEEPSVSGDCTFVDVQSGSYYEKAIIWAAEHGIVNGYGNGSFGPDDNITREQMVVILYRYMQYKGMNVRAGEVLNYNDAQMISDYALPAMQWACEAGILQGTGKDIMPGSEATRAQVAAILHRFCEVIK